MLSATHSNAVVTSNNKNVRGAEPAGEPGNGAIAVWGIELPEALSPIFPGI
jgi:hypothetical protein